MFSRTTRPIFKKALQTGSTNKVSSAPSLFSSIKRNISVAANPTVPSKNQPGHVTTLLHAKETGLRHKTEFGWGGGGNRIGAVSRTTFMRNGQQQSFPGVHNEGKFDPANVPARQYKHKETLPPLNANGKRVLSEFKQAHETTGYSYMTTHKEGTFNDKRTRNCVGFQEHLFHELSGVKLNMDVHAMPQDFVRAVRRNKAIISKGMEFKGNTDPKHTANIPWVNTQAEQEIVDKRNKLK